MVIVALIVVGLCMGSFVNALVWRLREQELQAAKKKPDAKYLKRLSIAKGRSMCPGCKHELAAKDLLPVVSWLTLRGRCRYCHKPISAEYPIVEAATALVFTASYLWWPEDIAGIVWLQFVVWLAAVVALMALLVYDLHWKLLPDRVMALLAALGGVYALITITESAEPIKQLVSTAMAVAVGGGIFYILFQISSGKWIGGGDVKLGWALGLFLATPGHALLMIFMASLLGTALSLPFLLMGKLNRASVIPFGPFLIAAAYIGVLWGDSILDWYQATFLGFTL